MDMSKEVKQESSIPVQTRASFMSLAKLHVYWTLEGYEIRTMSQLVGWSVDLLCEVLEANGKMPAEISTLAEAHRYLQTHGLYQKSLKERSMRKIGTALRFETMRGHGENPSNVAPVQHRMLHKKNSVEVLDNPVSSGQGTSNNDWERIQSKIKEANEKDTQEAIRQATQNAKDGGLIVEEPEMLCQEEARAKYYKELAEANKKKEKDIERNSNKSVLDEAVMVKEGMTEEEYEVKMREIAKRDKERLALENAPVEISEANIVREGN